MTAWRTLSGKRAVTVAGLVVGAAGIAVLWASGVEFPVAIPPGLVILLVGALFVGLAPWRWATGVGAFLGLFVTCGFLISGGIPAGVITTQAFGAERPLVLADKGVPEPLNRRVEITMGPGSGW